MGTDTTDLREAGDRAAAGLGHVQNQTLAAGFDILAQRHHRRRMLAGGQRPLQTSHRWRLRTLFATPLPLVTDRPPGAP